MATYSFRRVFIEVVTSTDLRSQENVGRMLSQLDNFYSQDAQIVAIHTVAREDTLEQIVFGGKENIAFSDHVEPSLGHERGGYKDCLEEACIRMGMEPDALVWEIVNAAG